MEMADIYVDDELHHCLIMMLKNLRKKWMRTWKRKSWLKVQNLSLVGLYFNYISNDLQNETSTS